MLYLEEKLVLSDRLITPSICSDFDRNHQNNAQNHSKLKTLLLLSQNTNDSIYPVDFHHKSANT